MRRSKLVINCQPSISPFLKKEVEDLGYKILRAEKNGVTIEGGWQEVIDLNMNLRTASRVLWLIKSFEATNPDRLYEEAKKIPWHKIIPKDGYVSIQSYVKNDFIRDIRFANLKLKDAIVDRMHEENGIRPDSGKERDRTVVYLYWHLNKVWVYIDTSGETIAKHGYRKIPFKAPMIEALASACLLSAGWNDDKGSFVNPMCGSGTLAIEAAMMAAEIPPGYRRKNFGFMHINTYDPQMWEEAVAKVKIKNKIKSKIIATDWNGDAIEAARINAKLAGVDHMIHFEKMPFEQSPIPEGPGMIILNPEYGERLGEEVLLKSVYKDIGDFFKQSCQGKMGYIFTGNSKLAKVIGLRTKSRTEFQNAKIDCRLLEYELYDGSRRDPESRPSPKPKPAPESDTDRPVKKRPRLTRK
ncbi:THUMP domain-containing class I SAM-dependent RNA methyltransferase [Reichenbachiella ulvae]|uniref:Class I SAM-dependent RNA methyltransferase n=1 Tax=Reichenbachiella ulvae TaxID=2980104 RepID=A0ABT3D090_9BACT|nr:class I SAM-dependent RNA methyltransferase [Reichenbachiella ulvae]MCV9389365.1 class I SAM-dependent RNA methyltransferase [Reichenbachiella ulvae]